MKLYIIGNENIVKEKSSEVLETSKIFIGFKLLWTAFLYVSGKTFHGHHTNKPLVHAVAHSIKAIAIHSRYYKSNFALLGI